VLGENDELANDLRQLAVARLVERELDVAIADFLDLATCR